MVKREIIYIGICFLIFACLRFVFAFLDANMMQFLLMPTNKLIEIIIGSKAVYIDEVGYFHSQLNIVINKSCSGYTFWLIGFLMASFVLIKSQKINFLLIIPLSLFLSYVATLLANVSRITGYILLMRGKLPQYIDPTGTWLHQMEGIFVYLSFLILFFFILNYTITKIKDNEKIA
ncbi:exosortase K [Dysgonomonas alginatilytica]|uniref:Exosortase K n=1 Tax=Dysgonomonas alginatilytica TaxID=1605892 RepID=A0A2V3PKK9_9BACT|nr:exosortase K [Dysgonomonas alginatilytica]PXV61993.1 exosortase K [Dysgonomonas alginatilytica]